MATQQTGSDRFISRQRPQGRGSGVKGVWETTAVPGVCRMTLLLLASGYLGLRMMALEAQLKSLGALTELLLHSREWVGVHSSQSKSTGRRGAGRTLSQPPLAGKKTSHEGGSNRFGWHCSKKPSHVTADYTSHPAGWQQQRRNTDR